MKILSWNVRGVGRKGFIQQVHELVSLYHPNLLFFMEMEVSSNKASIRNLIFTILSSKKIC